MEYITRLQENILKKRVQQSKVLLLTGARQTGKSTIINHVFSEYQQVSLDTIRQREQAKKDPQLFLKNNPCPLFIDEVQKEASILEYIKDIVDKSHKKGQFILSGSQNLLLMKNLSDSLAGRISINELNGLSLREIHNVSFNERFIPTKSYITKREAHLTKYENIWQIIHKGSYPELYSSNREWNDFYNSYIKTYIERDINDFISSDELTFMKFLTACAARTGQMLDYANIASSVEVSQPTIKNWISVLERTGIIYLMQPYSSSALNRAIKRPKLYFRDTGLAAYLTKWNSAESLAAGAVAGNMFETFIVSEIIKSYVNTGRDYRFNVFYYRGKDKLKTSDNEIDLIIEENGVLYPIEIKLTANPKASMAATNTILDKIPDKQRGMTAIICMVDEKFYLRDNLIALPIEYI